MIPEETRIKRGGSNTGRKSEWTIIATRARKAEKTRSRRDFAGERRGLGIRPAEIDMTKMLVIVNYARGGKRTTWGRCRQALTLSPISATRDEELEAYQRIVAGRGAGRGFSRVGPKTTGCEQPTKSKTAKTTPEKDRTNSMGARFPGGGKEKKEPAGAGSREE